MTKEQSNYYEDEDNSSVLGLSSSSPSNLSSKRSRQEKTISLQLAVDEPKKKSSSSSSTTSSSTSGSGQLALLLFILLVDIFIVSHMIFNGSSGSPRMYFLYGVKKFYIEYPNRSWTLAHASIGVIPLILSLYQISSFMRQKSLGIHRNVGRLLIACGVLQIPTTIYLGVNWADKEVVDVMRALFVIFAFLWGLWGMAVLYYIRWKRNIDLHRQWAVRFAVISHFVPIFGRLLTILIWFFYGQPEEEEGKIQSLKTTIWTLLAIFFPFQEFFVWLESGKCWFHSPHSSRNQENEDNDAEKKEKWDDDGAAGSA